MDDLITRLRTLMAEVEARIQHGETLSDEDISPRLKEALSLPPVDKAGDSLDLTAAQVKQYQPLKPQTRPLVQRTGRDNTRDTTHLKDYIPDPMHTYPAEDFIGSGDRDPLGHEELIRR